MSKKKSSMTESKKVISNNASMSPLWRSYAQECVIMRNAYQSCIDSFVQEHEDDLLAIFLKGKEAAFDTIPFMARKTAIKKAMLSDSEFIAKAFIDHWEAKYVV